MKQKTKSIELLAPAKNYECGVAAINHGADAVYIAAQSFGAREAAGNPITDIERLVHYAHKYYAKVYLVVNTILYDNEVQQACEIIRQAYHSGCDAAIIQDMGLLEADLPPIPLFASTQTHNYNVEHIKFLESVGFRRVILARELSLQQITEIHQQTNVDLEAFVHGALCVSYSGQCYISSATTARSANRGACAQLCRLPYDLIDERGNTLAKQKHLLSLRDLNLSDYLGDLLDAGITSFKIEGRLKDISYVKNITALYRKQLDTLLNQSTQYKKSSSGTIKTTFVPDAQRSFARGGFTTYFLKGRESNIASFDSPKSTGQYLGKVIKKDKNSFSIKSDIPLNNGDGICFINKQGKLIGVRVNKVDGGCIYPLSMEGIDINTKIYRNHDYLFDKQLSGNSALRQIHATVSFQATLHNIIIKAIDEDGVTATLQTEQCAQAAQNKEKALQTINEQLSKTGGTLFTFDNIDVEDNEVYFFPTAQLNAWRRELIDLLEQARAAAYIQPSAVIEPNNTPYPLSTVNYTTNIANDLAKKFYQRHGVQITEQAFEIERVNNTPQGTPLMYNRYCIKYEMGLCPTHQGAKPTGNLYLQHNKTRFKLVFNCLKCEMTVVKL